VAKINSWQVTKPLRDFTSALKDSDVAETIFPQMPDTSDRRRIVRRRKCNRSTDKWAICGIKENQSARYVVTESPPDTDMEILRERNAMIPRRHRKSQKPQNKRENGEN